MTTPPTDELRAWARQNGFAVADRGRLSAEILAAWQTSQKSEVPKSPKHTSPANGQVKTAKAETAKAETAKAETAKAETAKAETPSVSMAQPSATAGTDHDDILDLRDEVSTLRARVDALESRLTAAPPRRRFLRSRA